MTTTISPLPPPESARVLADLRELRALTATDAGAQRVAWGPVWRRAREWFQQQLRELHLSPELDAAGNSWVTLPGASPKTVIIGSHLDSVPNGGWLDGCLGVLTALEALRRHAAAGRPPVTLRLVDWADEEGARFGRSLLGSSAASGSLEIEQLRGLRDRQGTTLPEALQENGLSLERLPDARSYLAALEARAYLELHIEQGPVLESLGRPTGAVIGTFGVERHTLRFSGQAAHSGATPIPLRRDAFLAAAEFALACREIAERYSTREANVVSTCGVIKVEPGIVTAVPGQCEISLDQRALDRAVLARMLEDARSAAADAAARNRVTVAWAPLWRIEPRLFDPQLIELCAEAVREVTGAAPRLPSGPLHDAAEMVPHMPTVMMFSSSARGLSHCLEEDTPIDHLDQSIRAFLLLVERTVAHVARG